MQVSKVSFPTELIFDIFFSSLRRKAGVFVLCVLVGDCSVMAALTIESHNGLGWKGP